MVESDAFGQFIVKIGDFGTAYFTDQDQKINKGNQN